MPQRLILVSGWAHLADALLPLKVQIGLPQGIELSLAELYQKGEVLGSQQTFSPYALGLAEVVKEVVQKEVDGRCVLVGWSMGGMVALEALELLSAVGKPVEKMVEALVLISSTARFCRAGDYEVGVSLSALKALRLELKRDSVTAVERFYSEVYGPSHQQVPAEIFSCGDQILNDGLWYLEKTDLRSMLGRVCLPVLVIHGTKDQIVPLQAGEFLVERIPGATLKVIEGGKHGMIRDREQEIGECIRQFLKK